MVSQHNRSFESLLQHIARTREHLLADQIENVFQYLKKLLKLNFNVKKKDDCNYQNERSRVKQKKWGNMTTFFCHINEYSANSIDCSCFLITEQELPAQAGLLIPNLLINIS